MREGNSRLVQERMQTWMIASTVTRGLDLCVESHLAYDRLSGTLQMRLLSH